MNDINIFEGDRVRLTALDPLKDPEVEVRRATALALLPAEFQAQLQR